VYRRPRLPRWLLPACLLLAVSTSPVLAARGPYRAASPEYGVSAFLYDQPATTQRDLGKVQALGFGWVKSVFRWIDIEPGYKGDYHWGEADRVVQTANAAGLRIIARLDFQPGWARAGSYIRNAPPDNYQDYADMVYAFVARYSEGSPYGRVQAVQIWNEPNLMREWGERPITQQSAAEYVRLLSLSYKAAHGAEPSITVIGGSLSPTGVSDPACCQPDDQYLQWMFQFGLKGNYDVLGVNANVQCPCVDAAPGTVAGFGDPSFYFRRTEQLHDIMVANGDGDKQVWLMEFGWTTDPVHASYSWYATTEAKKAELIVQAFQFARQNWAPWIGVMSLWSISDPQWGPEDEQVWWSVTNPDGTTRPAYDRLLQARVTGELP
jgi:polysaccharide biosynthesis protein PslG